MPHPMVIAYHLIWTIYGYWLPNDPRGSTSRVIRNDILKELGELHYGRKKIQPSRTVLREFDRRAEPLLQHVYKEFTRDQRQIVALAFEQVIQLRKYTCYACAIMCDHVHLLIRKHRDTAEEMIAHLQRQSHLDLRESGCFTMEHPVWGGHGWSVFLDHPDDVWRTIEYVRGNPDEVKSYPFVTQYNNWPLHPGHSLSSPYVKRLKQCGF